MMEWNSQDGIAKLSVGFEKKIMPMCSSGSLQLILGIFSLKCDRIHSDFN